MSEYPLMPSDEPRSSAEDPLPLPQLVKEERGGASGFLTRVNDSIHRRVSVAHAIEFSLVPPALVLLEFVHMVGEWLGGHVSRGERM